MRDATIVFDLDGTLVDTAPDLIGATNHVLASLGLSAADPVRQRDAVSFGARRMILAGLAQHGVEPHGVDLDALHTRFIAHYEANISATSRPFPGAVGVLDGLRDAGARLAICTNKREVHARHLIRALGLEDRFAAIAGIDTFAVCKPHGDHVLGTIAAAGGAPGRAVMIGDSANDILAARAAAVPVIGCTFGYSDVPVEEFAPDVVISDYREVPPAIARLLGCG